MVGRDFCDGEVGAPARWLYRVLFAAGGSIDGQLFLGGISVHVGGCHTHNLRLAHETRSRNGRRLV